MNSTRIDILEDLSDDTPDGDPLPWLTRCRLADYDHLVLVTDQPSGRYLGFLAATDGATTRDGFLLLETAFVAPVARGQNLMRRMIALAMLRIGGIGAVPSVIVACTRNPICYRIMRETARHFTGAVFFPDPDSVTINFQTATLAQRIAREIGPNHRFQATTGTIRGGMMVTAGASRYRRLPVIRSSTECSACGCNRLTGCWPCSIFVVRTKPPSSMMPAGSIDRADPRSAPRTAAGTGDEPSRDRMSARSTATS